MQGFFQLPGVLSLTGAALSSQLAGNWNSMHWEQGGGGPFHMYYTLSLLPLPALTRQLVILPAQNTSRHAERPSMQRKEGGRQARCICTSCSTLRQLREVKTKNRQSGAGGGRREGIYTQGGRNRNPCSLPVLPTPYTIFRPS
jgi:hypothetical protein